MPVPTDAAGRKRVLVLGAGFGGLSCARALKGQPVDVTLVDRVNFHLFQPMLYEVATASLGVNEIAATTRKIFRHQPNVSVRMAEMAGVDVARRQARCSDGQVLDYDYLVMSPGVVTDYFGHPEWAEYAPGLKTLEDALELRRRVLQGFELAENEPDAEKRRALLTFVIVGGGATGVEMAGAIGELKKYTLRKDFRHIDSREARILLLDAADRVLPSFSKPLSDYATRTLQALGVEVRTGVRVSEVGPAHVVAGGERIGTQCVLWSAGTRGAPVLEQLGVPLDRAGRAIVGPDIAVAGHPEVFVLGDAAHIEDGQGQPLPGVGPVAIQTGRHAARCIVADLAGRPRPAFKYFDKGKLAVIGRGHAVCEVGPLRFSGALAWLTWALVHVMFLVGFRNRVVAMSEWARTYFFQDRAARIIVGKL